MYKLYLSYSEQNSGGGISEGQENESFPERDTGHITFKPLGLYTQAGDWQETIVVDFDPEKYIDKSLFLVVVRYFDGDTFGSTSGHWCVEAILTSQEEATEMKKKIQDGTYTGKRGYLPWATYFAGLEDVEIHGTKLNNAICSGVEWF